MFERAVFAGRIEYWQLAKRRQFPTWHSPNLVATTATILQPLHWNSSATAKCRLGSLRAVRYNFLPVLCRSHVMSVSRIISDVFSSCHELCIINVEQSVDTCTGVNAVGQT